MTDHKFTYLTKSQIMDIIVGRGLSAWTHVFNVGQATSRDPRRMVRFLLISALEVLDVRRIRMAGGFSSGCR